MVGSITNFIGTLLVFLSLTISHIVKATVIPGGITIFDVMNFGAIGDGKTDDSKAFLSAWSKACNCSGSPALQVPSGKTFLLNPITFMGPCNSSQIQFLLSGNIVAPNNFDGWKNCKEDSWIYFGNVHGLQFTGHGNILGNGALWWGKKISSIVGCENRPTALRFHACNNSRINGTTHMNSPWNHIQIEASQNVELSRLKIIAPFDSPNTDGIDISTSTNVSIHDCYIGSGDDCIAIKAGSSFVNITRVNCGPGHGISIGSLGQGGPNVTDIVEHIFVSNCTLNGTTNGARIKTRPGGLGHVSNVTFQGITLINSENPIIIDQLYYHPPTNVSLQVKHVTFRGFQGTSATKEAITLQCDVHVPCTNLTFDNINIQNSAKIIETTLISKCQNAHGIQIPPVVPNVTCLLS